MFTRGYTQHFPKNVVGARRSFDRFQGKDPMPKRKRWGAWGAWGAAGCRWVRGHGIPGTWATEIMTDIYYLVVQHSHGQFIKNGGF